RLTHGLTRRQRSFGNHQCFCGVNMAERVGFEPTLEFPLNTLSKRAPSATRPSLRLESVEGTTLKKHSPSRQSWRSTARWVFSILWGKPSHRLGLKQSSKRSSKRS